jgi:hypothetical protein
MPKHFCQKKRTLQDQENPFSRMCSINQSPEINPFGSAISNLLVLKKY